MDSYFKLIKKSKHGLLMGALLMLMGLLAAPPAEAAIGDRLEVSAKNAMLYAGPASSAARVSRLANGDQMVEMERQGGWVFVSLKKGGAQGWVDSSAVRKAVMKPRPVQKVKVIKKGKTVIVKKIPEEVSVKVPDLPVISRKVSLENLGYRKGIMFEGAASAHSRTVFFDAPMDSQIAYGTFRMLFRASPNLHKLANVRVSVNDMPYKEINIPSSGGLHQMDVLLPSSAFRGKLVKISVHASLPVSDDRCFDERLTNVFLHVLPESTLDISYQPVEKSIRDAWRLLPQDVTISLSSGSLRKSQFASALAMMAMLVDAGKTVKIARLPEVGHIVVAPKSEIESLLDQKLLLQADGKPIKETGNALDHSSNLALMRLPSRSVIVVTDPYDVQPMYLLNDSWQLTAAGDHYRVYRPDNLLAHTELLGTEGDAGYYSLPMDKLGMNTDAKYLTREVTWQTVVSPFALPLGTLPDFMLLNIVAPVRWEKDPTYELYVFLNDVLVKSARLENTGLKQQFTVNLPSEYQKQFNDIRVVVQHDIETGDCRAVRPHDYVQVTPDSALVVKREDGSAPKKFSDLSRYFLHGFDTYLSFDYLENPEHVLQLLARLAADFPLMIDHTRVHFVEKGEKLAPEGPFVAVGNFPLSEGIEAPVRFDQGRVKIVSPNGESYFDVSKLSGVTVAEIAKSFDSYGLWINPSDKLDGPPMVERIQLAEDDVAFIDASGVIKTLDSSEPSLAQVYYPDVEDWFDVLGKYRFWLMVLLWFLLTMVVVYLYRMSRANKMAREEDDALYQEEENRMQGDHAAHMHDDHTIHPTDSLDHLDEKR